MALEDATTIVYLCSTGYAPDRDRGVHALYPAIGITWPAFGRDGTPVSPRLSVKDAAAPTLAEAAAAGLLPRSAAVDSFLRSLA
jgi:dTDP-4-dehydrorhamnose 3,5-epimerase